MGTGHKDPTGDKVIDTLIGFLGLDARFWVLSTRIQLGTRHWLLGIRCWAQGFGTEYKDPTEDKVIGSGGKVISAWYWVQGFGTEYKYPSGDKVLVTGY